MNVPLLTTCAPTTSPSVSIPSADTSVAAVLVTKEMEHSVKVCACNAE